MDPSGIERTYTIGKQLILLILFYDNSMKVQQFSRPLALA